MHFCNVFHPMQHFSQPATGRPIPPPPYRIRALSLAGGRAVGALAEVLDRVQDAVAVHRHRGPHLGEARRLHCAHRDTHTLDLPWDDRFEDFAQRRTVKGSIFSATSQRETDNILAHDSHGRRHSLLVLASGSALYCSIMTLAQTLASLEPHVLAASDSPTCNHTHTHTHAVSTRHPAAR
jgi:hypothetical protein